MILINPEVEVDRGGVRFFFYRFVIFFDILGGGFSG